MLARSDVIEHLLDIYGRCDRDQPKRNDCYWGKDASGRENGCLKTGWLGRACPHWQPAGAEEIDVIAEVHYSRGKDVKR